MTSDTGRGKAIFVTQWFAPEAAAQATRLARVLHGGGYETTVVTGIPNYPTGRVFPGYRSTQRSSENWEGIKVVRSPLYPSHDSKAARRIANYVSWALSATLLSTGQFKGARVSLVYSSPATTALPAMVARRVFGVPYVLLIQDLWPDSVLSSGFLPSAVKTLVGRTLEVFVRATYRWATHIVVISPGMMGVLEDRGVSRGKISLVYNAVEESPSAKATSTHSAKASTHTRTSLGLPEDAFVVMYGGNHGAAQDLGTVIRAFGAAGADRPLHLVLVGDGVEKAALQELARNEAFEKVTFLPPVTREQFGALMDIADVQLVSLAPDPLFAVTMPSKVQGILAAGHPVWVIGEGDVAAVIGEAHAGVSSPPQDVGAAVSALEDMARLPREELNCWGRAGQTYYGQKMAPAVVGRQLLAILESCANDSGS